MALALQDTIVTVPEIPEKKHDIIDIIEKSQLKADYIFQYPTVCLYITGDSGSQIFSTLGNFSVILAGPKAGKTTAVSVAVVSLITNSHNSKFKGELSENKRTVVMIDTEQGKPECLKIIQSICQQVNGDKTKNSENLIYLSLRGQNKNIISEVIDYMVFNTPNIGFLVIDGVRDLVTSINDEREAAQTAEKLLRWTQEADIHILTILHQNKGDLNARGHLGTELMNKAETVVSLSKGEKNGNRITLIEPKFTRHKDFEPFAFSVDENGFVIDSEVSHGYDKKSPKVDQLTNQQLEDIVKLCFTNAKFYSYGKLWPEIQKSLKKIEIEYGDNKCKDVIKKLKTDGYIIADDNTPINYHSNVPV